METDDYLPLSGLQHLLFCERQCALIHVEGEWAENPLTLSGRELHEKTDLPGIESRPWVRIARAVFLRSDRLRLVGRADIVEYHLETVDGASVWRPFPIEYKRGRRGQWAHDEVQLCAQAICLEEVHGLAVPEGALFYGQSRRRRDVSFDASLRETTAAAAARFHEMMRTRETPRVARQPKCRRCSLLQVCMPQLTDPARSVAAHLRGSLRRARRGFNL